jgi:hypothetical protein
MGEFRRILALAGALAFALLATGCASVAGGNTQKMYVQARTAEGAAVEGADCTLSNDKGSWRVRSPGDSTVVRSYKAIEVRCDKQPLPRGIVSVESGVRAAMFGNILIGGVIGAVVDHTSGAAYEYPEQVRVVMGRTSTFTLPRGTNPGGYEPRETGFAPLQDADAVPYMGARGRDGYREWLTRPHPRAFAIAPNSYYYTAWGTHPQNATDPADPKERALSGCERAAKVPCKLYAVDDHVVWDGEPVSSRTAADAAGGYEPPATNFAPLQDADAIPNLDAAGRVAYRDWLTHAQPRAFALSADGHYASIWGTRPADTTLPSDPKARALLWCERRAKAACQLYAVNDKVVWDAAEMARRTPAPSPAAQGQAIAGSGVVPVSTSAATPRTQPAFIASGYAAIEDVDALPYLSDRGRDEYRQWLTRPTPKAFAISERGQWWAAWGLSPQDTTMPSDPSQRALVACQRAAGTPCKLYAVNGSVVWKP